MSTAINIAELDQETLRANLDNPTWRISNLYKIIIKGETDDDDLVVLFKPNRAQRRLIARLWSRNIILKARQLGFTTLIAILWLDTALFSQSPIRCGIIAQDLQTASLIFRDKVKFAYENLPEQLRAAMPLASCNKSEMVFGHNGSSIRVSTSMRGGTIHRLHISEYGKICATNPKKEKEIVTGSIPAVTSSGILVIESTAEGQEGDFYEKSERARALQEQNTPLTVRDYRFHFYPWWDEPGYCLSVQDTARVVIDESWRKYFTEVEGKIGRRLTAGQRAWYVATCESDFSGDRPRMWQEYPSFPEEAFQVSTEGCWYASQLALARKSGRIGNVPLMSGVPCNTFWDIGRGDMTSIWVHQRVAAENRFVRYYENSGEDLSHYAQWLQRLGVVFGTHYLPHEAAHKRMGETPDTNRSIKEMLEGLMRGQRFELVPVISDITVGIQATRNVFASCWFDQEGCAQGLKRIGGYRKEWNKTLGCWRNYPAHDDNSHGSDAFRQFGQEADRGNQFPHGGRSSGGIIRRNRSGMAV